LEYLKINKSLRRLVLTDSLMGILDPSEQQDGTDPYQQRSFLQEVSKVLECQNDTLHWVVTRTPLACVPDESYVNGGASRQQHRKLDTLLHLNRSGLRDVSLRPELQFTCPRHMWPELLCKLGQSSPTAVFDVLHRNFEAFFIRQPSP